MYSVYTLGGTREDVKAFLRLRYSVTHTYPPTQILAGTVYLKSNRGVYAWVIHLQKLTPQAALRESLAEPVRESYF